MGETVTPAPAAEQSESDKSVELGKRVHGLVIGLRSRVFETLGLDPSSLPRSTTYSTETRMRFPDPRHVTAKVGQSWRGPEGVEVVPFDVTIADIHGNPTIGVTRYVSPEGHMYRATDSADGPIWSDTLVLHPALLGDVADGLTRLGQSLCDVHLNLGYVSSPPEAETTV
jgi:hypothetical protein